MTDHDNHLNDPEDNDTEGGGVSPIMRGPAPDGIQSGIAMALLAEADSQINALDSRAGRERAIRKLHKDVATTLAGKRHRRDALEAEIRELVGEEYRLGRMVRILDRASEGDGQ